MPPRPFHASQFSMNDAAQDNAAAKHSGKIPKVLPGCLGIISFYGLDSIRRNRDKPIKLLHTNYYSQTMSDRTTETKQSDLP